MTFVGKQALLVVLFVATMVFQGHCWDNNEGLQEHERQGVVRQTWPSVPGDVVSNSDNHIGYVIRALDEDLHSPPVLVAWNVDSSQSTVSWELLSSITLTSNSESSNFLGTDFVCRSSSPVSEAQYNDYMIDHLKTGMLVRFIIDTIDAWRGDTCVKVGSDDLLESEARLYCFRREVFLTLQNLTYVQIMGITNYPGIYDQKDDSGDLVGNYQYPMVNKYYISGFPLLLHKGDILTVNLTLICGEFVDVHLNYDRTILNSEYHPMESSFYVDTESTITMQWQVVQTGYRYVQIRITNDDGLSHYVGWWLYVTTGHVNHDFEIQGSAPDDRFILVGESLVGSQTLLAGSDAVMAYVHPCSSYVNHSIHWVLPDQEVTFPLEAVERGPFEIVSFAWTLFSMEMIFIEMISVKPFPVYPVLSSDHFVIAINETIQVDFSSVSGVGSVCKISFGDCHYDELNNNYSLIFDQLPQNWTDFNLTAHTDEPISTTFTHVYEESGWYMISVYCGTVFFDTTVLVQTSITGLDVVSDEQPMLFGDPLWANITWLTGTDMSIQVFYNDVLCWEYDIQNETAVNATCLVNDTLFMDEDGVVAITVHAWNSVSNVTAVTNATVLIPIDVLSVVTVTSDLSRQGIFTEDNILVFPLEHEVQMTVEYYGMVPDNITWNITCDNGIVELSNTQSISVETLHHTDVWQYTFQSSNSTFFCFLGVTVNNALSSDYSQMNFTLEESIVFISMSNDGPKKNNNTFRIDVHFEKIGGHPCLEVDLGEGTVLYYGTVDTCTIHPGFTNVTGTLAPDIFLLHKYALLGVYHVKIKASNRVSTVTSETQVVVLDFDCFNPNVTIKGLTPNTSYILNAARVYKSSEILFETENEVYCEKTDIVHYNWSVSKLDEDPRLSPYGGHVGATTLLHLPVSVDLHSPMFIIPPRTLAYGFYAITATVYMDGLHYVFGEGLFYIHVIQTPWIEAALPGGALFEEYYRNQAVLDASASIDPDFDGDEGLEGMEFEWFCKDIDDDVVFDYENEALIHVPEETDTIQPPSVNSSGCFGTNRGKLDAAGVILKMQTFSMIEGRYYWLTLRASKYHPEFGLRRSTFDIYFHVMLGLPPKMSISCTINCLEAVNRHEKLIIQSTCTDHCYGELSILWRMYTFDDLNQPEPFNVTHLTEVPSELLQQTVNNPITELGLGFPPYSLQADTKYLIQVVAERTNEVFGEMRFIARINTVPVNGTFNISPSSGVAFKTRFAITFSNWFDEHMPLTFHLSYLFKGSKILLLQEQDTREQTVELDAIMPVGDEANNYQLDILIAVQDNIGGTTFLNTTLEVVPPNSKDLNASDLITSVSGEGNDLQKAIDDGRASAALHLACCVASVLNTIGAGSNVDSHNNDRAFNTTGHGNNGTIVDDDTNELLNKDQVDNIKGILLDSLSGLVLTDLQVVSQMSGALQIITDNPDDLSTDNQRKAIELCRRTVNSLKYLSEPESGSENIKTIAKNLVATVGQLTKVASGQTDANKTQGDPGLTKEAISMIDTLHDILFAYMVANEGPLTILTEYLSLQTEITTLLQFGNHGGNHIVGCGVLAPTANYYGEELERLLADKNASFVHLEEVKIKMAVFENNPYTWSNTSGTVLSKVTDYKLDFSRPANQSNLKENIAISIARDLSSFPQNSAFHMKPGKDGESFLKYHSFNRTNQWTSINFELSPEDVGHKMDVYLRAGEKPNLETGDYDMVFSLPDFKYCDLNRTADSENDTIIVDPYAHCQVHPYSVFVSNIDLNTTGTYWFAVHIWRNESKWAEDDDSIHSRHRRSFECDVGKRRMRRSCVIVRPPPPPPPTVSPFIILSADNLGFDGKFFFPNQTPNYNLTMFESSCIYWDEENQTWSGHGCEVGPLTCKDQIQCFCNHLTSFGSDLVVAPNPIDFSSVFANFDSLSNNVAVLALISSIVGLYIIGVIWGRKADKRDILMSGQTVLPTDGPCRYLITIFTGNRIQSGTTANVFIKISGDQNESLPVKLRDPERPCFERAQKNVFVLSQKESFGELTHVQIWHNNTGTSPSWYLSRLLIKDLETDKEWCFVCDNWLAVESADGEVCRVLSVANNEELTNFNHLFAARTVKGLADGHLWFSIYSRPAHSKFTRVQRLSCCLCLLCCTMITSAMFYNMGGQGPSPFTIHIGSLTIDLKGFVIGLQSSIIIVPVNVLLVQIFRNLKPKKSKEKTTSGKSDEGVDDLKDLSDDNRKMNDDESQRPSEGKLPHWFLYIAYALCYLTSAACIFFTMLYSIQWGEEVSTEWVIAMVTAFFQSVLLLQPIKVLMMAIVFALFIRKPCDSDDNESDEIKLDEMPEPVSKNARKKRKKEKIYSPPTKEMLLGARIQRLKEIKMKGIVIEIVTFFIFLGMLMIVAGCHRDPDAYLLSKTLYETFDDVDAFAVPFDMVSDSDSLWMWARETLVPGLYFTEWYNGKPTRKGYIGNHEDYLVGIPRIRQLRIKRDSCDIEQKYIGNLIPHCYDAYSITEEETADFDVEWKLLSSTSARRRRGVHEPTSEREWFSMISGTKEERSRRRRALDPISQANSGRNRRKKKRLLSSSNSKQIYSIADDALLPDGKVQSCLERWRHKTTLESRGFPYWGQISLYSGGGYAANLGYYPLAAYTVISDLHSNGWVDVQTRAVLVEFTVYNANTNLFGMVSMFIEFPSSSGAFVSADYQSSRFYLQLSFTETLAHVLVIFFMFYFLYREGKLLSKQRCSYFKEFWNCIEVLLIILEFATIVLFLARLYETDRNLIQLRENPNDYVGFQYAGSADAALVAVIGLLVFFYNIRFMRLLRFNKNFLVLGKTISRLAMPILGFCLPFFFGFMAFALFAFTVFGSELVDYSTFTMTVVTQFSMLLGDFDFEGLVMVNPVLGPLYFFSFVGLNVIVLMNVFIAIINDSYAEIQDEESETQNEYEIIDYVVKSMQQMIPKKKRKIAPRKRKKKIENRREPRYLSFSEDEKEKFVVSIEECEKRMDCLIDVINGSISNEAENEDAIISVPENKHSDVHYRLLLLMETMEEDDEPTLKESNEK